ncbi:substrate-binding domain-containing protein, partial [Bacillus amyloliquefaciens]|uniref:substrate-binding domain-containing protein n=2 Tax=Bacillaceae TaxID=186817 RepID=UPI001CB92503
GQLLAQYEVLDHTLADIRQGQAGLIHIGISEPTASLIFPAVLRGFLNDYPDMSVNVSVDDANTCSRKLLEGAIDFAVCGEPELILENYFDPFFHDSLNVILSDRHPLAAKASVNLEDLENECLIFTPANCPIRIQIEQHLQRAIGSRYRKMELTSSMAHQYYVRENIGVSIFTATAHSEPIEGTKVIPIRNLTISPPVGLLTNQKEEHFDSATKDLISRIIGRFQRDPH